MNCTLAFPRSMISAQTFFTVFKTKNWMEQGRLNRESTGTIEDLCCFVLNLNNTYREKENGKNGG
jgi:hypothetical protein